MRRFALLVAILSALSMAAYGEDPDSTVSSDAATETGAEAPTGDAAMTAKAFNKLPVEDEFSLIERLATADSDACADVNPRSEPFRQAVFINAAQAKPGTLIADLVAEQCEA